MEGHQKIPQADGALSLNGIHEGSAVDVISEVHRIDDAVDGKTLRLERHHAVGRSFRADRVGIVTAVRDVDDVCLVARSHAGRPAVMDADRDVVTRFDLFIILIQDLDIEESRRSHRLPIAPNRFERSGKILFVFLCARADLSYVKVAALGNLRVLRVVHDDVVVGAALRQPAGLVLLDLLKFRDDVYAFGIADLKRRPAAGRRIFCRGVDGADLTLTLLLLFGKAL